MDCIKKRDIFSLFNVFTCKTCKYYKEEELILIGFGNINIHHLFNNCPHLEFDEDSLFYRSKKLIYLLYEAILYHDKIFLLFIENDDLKVDLSIFISDYELFFEELISLGLSIQIITN